MICRRYLVTGRVQGVFYRASTQAKAADLGLLGWVRNCDDGSVELAARGDEQSLAELERWLWDGPKFADVAGVEVSTLDTGECNGFREFSIRY